MVYFFCKKMMMLLMWILLLLMVTLLTLLLARHAFPRVTRQNYLVVSLSTLTKIGNSLCFSLFGMGRIVGYGNKVRESF